MSFVLGQSQAAGETETLIPMLQWHQWGVSGLGTTTPPQDTSYTAQVKKALPWVAAAGIGVVLWKASQKKR